MMKIHALNTLADKDLRLLATREPSPSPDITRRVQKILADIRKKGHAEVLRLAAAHDGLAGNLQVTKRELEKAAKGVSVTVKKAIDRSIENVTAFHRKQVEKSWSMKGRHGESLGQSIRPLRRVGLYVPGGAGSYPSTVVMCAVPARVAGVEEIVLVSPAPRGVDGGVAYAALALGIREFYQVGGAQAVGLLAYGTDKVERVDKIVGPGNVYAAVAKREVFGLVDIDMIAGPSEILVLADDSADPDWVAADLLSQAEHGSGYEAAILITNSAAYAREVADYVEVQVEGSPKKALLQKSLAGFGRIYVVKDWKLGVAAANLLAPEHLEVMTRNAEALAKDIVNAGAVFIGPYSSEPVGDYFAGPNHVLPTNGSARFASPLGVYDFYKRTSIIRYSRAALKAEGDLIAALADAEGFIHHGAAVRKRLP